MQDCDFKMFIFSLLKPIGQWYVDDGCHVEVITGPPDDVAGSYQPISFKAGVRCCSMDGSQCNTPGKCPGNSTYYDAVDKCAAIGMRLCTKDELLSDFCCGKGGGCDTHAVWTSTGSGNIFQGIFGMVSQNY